MAKGDRERFQSQYGPAQQGFQSGQNQLMQNLYGQLYGYNTNTGQPYKSSQGGGGLYGQGEQERNALLGGYGGLANHPYGGLPQDVINNLRNISTPQIPLSGGSYGGYQGLAGYNPQINIDPELYKSLTGTLSKLQDFDWNPQDVQSIRNAISGLGGNIAGYQGFADTGGLTASDQANFRARSNAPVGAYYQSQQNELARLANQTGGSPYAQIAARANLARGGSQALADVSQGTESNLTNLINQGKLAGLAGVQQGYGLQGGLAQALASGEAASRLGGLNAALGGQSDLARLLSQNQIAGQQLGLQGRIAGLGGMSDIERANLSAMLSGNQLRAGNEQFLGQQGQYGQLAGLQGLQNVYGQVHGPSALAQNQLLSQFNQGNINQNDLLRLYLGGLTGIPSNAQQLWGNILGGVGAAGGLLTGIGALRNRR
jgi:hypothetical protein